MENIFVLKYNIRNDLELFEIVQLNHELLYILCKYSYYFYNDFLKILINR